MHDGRRELLTDRGCCWWRRRRRWRWWSDWHAIQSSSWLITGEGNVELAVFWQTESSPDGLCKLLVPVWAWLDLEAVRAPVEVDVHDRWSIRPAPRGKGGLPVWQTSIAEFTVGLFPVSTYRYCKCLSRLFAIEESVGAQSDIGSHLATGSTDL